MSLSSLLVVVVVVFGAHTDAAPHSVFDVSPGMRGQPWLPGYPLSYYPAPDFYPSTDDFLGTRGDYSKSSIQDGLIGAFNRRVLEAQRRYQDDLQTLRRQLEEQGHPLRTPAPDMPLYFPMFPFPNGPKDVGSEEKKDEKKPVKDEDDDESKSDEDDGGDSGDSGDSGDIEGISVDSPTPGNEWQVIPLLPEVPDADDLPDNYDNSTHVVHVINGSRVEVNTTTHKESGDDVTTFFHTEVINILPEETKTEEDTTEDPVAEGEEGVTEKAEGPDKEEIHHAGTLNIPSDLAELIKEVSSV
ncbi:uncharacterized protein LOC127005252 [Eriocheir sinensis]|uniref:uncharacterized protein LOC127005252 n=1 Tax=Eriocheir sinensis TaxID=95602 RepID=UPI0021C8A25D|nr:uncharacterized protein LOC127005252 [Eriocheir sinensis]